MKSIREVAASPAAVRLLADEILEFHAARLLLLFLVCGTAGRIEGLTKMAKLDFFVRYPDFFRHVCKKLGINDDEPKQTFESAMIRHHYGPWDPRYYQILAYLEGRELIAAKQNGNAFTFELTPSGKATAKVLKKNPAFDALCEQMQKVKKALGARTGSSLKTLIYETFQHEVALRPKGKTIQRL